MTRPAEGAQLSEDGHYWWDAGTNAWQSVAGGAADPTAADPTAAAPSAAAPSAADPSAADPAAGGDSWPPAGYPQDPADWTKEQLEYWFGHTQDASQDIALGGDTVNVVAIADLDAGSRTEGIA